MDWLIARAKERSTWLGLLGLLSVVGITFSPEDAEVIASAAMAIVSAALMLLGDKTPPTPPTA